MQFPVQIIGKHVGAGSRMKYAAWRYEYAPEADISKPLQRITDQFITRYWSTRNIPEGLTTAKLTLTTYTGGAQHWPTTAALKLRPK